MLSFPPIFSSAHISVPWNARLVHLQSPFSFENMFREVCGTVFNRFSKQPSLNCWLLVVLRFLEVLDVSERSERPIG